MEKSKGPPLRVLRRVDACPTKLHGGSISQIYETWGCEKRRRSQQVATLPHGEPPSWRRNGKGGAGAQTIAIPALPQRARCALSQ